MTVNVPGPIEDDSSYFSPNTRDQYNFTFFKERQEHQEEHKQHEEEEKRTHMKTASLDTVLLAAVQKEYSSVRGTPLRFNDRYTPAQ